MTLLGAGGAATAILVQAALDGVAEINVFNVRDNVLRAVPRRSWRSSTSALAARLPCTTYSDPEVLRASIADSAILVNGTSVGMAPKTENVPSSRTRAMFHKDLFVFRCDLQSAGDTPAA